MVGMAEPTATAAAVGWPSRVDGEWTVDLLQTLPDDGLRYEIIDGTLIVSPSPVPRHQRAILRLALLLTAACPPDHEVFIAPLDWQPDRRTSLGPDLLVVRKDRIGETNITQTPTLVVEVLSPGTARIDRRLKFSRYAEGGIEQYWIIDPRAPSVEIYRLVDGDYLLVAQGRDDEIVTVTDPFSLSVVPRGLVSD